MLKVFIAICIAWAPTAFCQTDVASENAKKLVETVILEGMSTKASESIVQQGLKRHKVNVSSDVREKIVADMRLVIAERLRASDGIIDRLARIYSKLFTAEEIDILLKFFSTETGRKFILNERKVTDLLAAESDEWMDVLLRDIDSQFVTILGKYERR